MQPSTIRTTTINTMHDPNILGSWHLQSTTITRSVPVEACYNPRAPHALLPHWAGLGRVAPSQPPPPSFTGWKLAKPWENHAGYRCLKEEPLLFQTRVFCSEMLQITRNSQ